MELQKLFSTVLNMTVTASVVIGCVILARLVLKKAPRVYSYALWAVVLFRLLCPVSISAPVSVLNVVEAPEPQERVGTVIYMEASVRAPVETIYVEAPHVQEGTPSVSSVAEPPVDWDLIAARGWAVGVGALAVYGIASYVNLKRKLREAVPAGKGIRETDGIKSPFVLGFFRPVIYLPSDLKDGERGYILLHERHHIRHGDHLVKAAFFLAVCLHWFNPLVWLAFVLCTRDMEMRCDEAVLKELGPQVRSDYAQSLLNLAAGRHPAPAPLAFGEGDTGKRVKHVLGWKRRTLWIVIPAAVICAVVLVITAVNPGGSPFGESPFGHSYKAATVVPTRYDEPVEQEQLFTLTSDMDLFIRDAQETSLRGSFQKLSRLPDSCAAYDPVEWALLKGEIGNAWEADDYLLLQLEDGTLYLIQGETAWHLERTDLLGVTVRQPGSESQIEAIWYRADSPDWYTGALSGTMVDGDAQVHFQVEKKYIEQITVSEEYYERLADDSTDIHKNTYTLEPGEDGSYVLDVSRRGTVGDDHAIYRVTVGSDTYLFRLVFPAVPWVTSFEGVPEEEQTREVSFSENGTYITLQLPESWEYTVTSFEDDAYSAGITFWPRGREEGKLRFEYYPSGFGVCGTGLESRTMTLADREVSMGTYDGASLWDFLSFGDDFAVWGEGHDSWWAEYGKTAMEILDSAQFGEIRGYVDMDAVHDYFRNYRLDDLGPGTVLPRDETFPVAKNYQAVYYGRDNTIRLFQYDVTGPDQVEVHNEWFGRVYEDVCISINCLRWDEHTYIYYGCLNRTQDGVDLKDGQIVFHTDDNWMRIITLTEVDGFCFTSQAPIEDFVVYTAGGEAVLELQGYLDRGFLICDSFPVPEGEPICVLPISPTEP